MRMPNPLYDIFALLVGLFSGLRDPQVRGLLGLTVTLVAIAAQFYHWAEGWSLLDATYFSVATIATVGYGDFVPVTAAGKLFTIIYICCGVGLFVAAVGSLAEHLVRRARGRDAG